MTSFNGLKAWGEKEDFPPATLVHLVMQTAEKSAGDRPDRTQRSCETAKEFFFLNKFIFNSFTKIIHILFYFTKITISREPTRQLGQIAWCTSDGTTTEALVCHLSQSRASGATETCTGTVDGPEQD